MDEERKVNQPENQPEQNPQEESAFRKVVMNALDGIGSAMEKAAQAVEKSNWPEKVESLAKKGGEAFQNIAERGGEVFEQVKDYGTHQWDKLKNAVEDPEVEAVKTTGDARTALLNALETLTQGAQDARDGLNATPDDEQLIELLRDYQQTLGNQRGKIAALTRRFQALHNPAPQTDVKDDEPRVKEPADSEIPYESHKAPLDPKDTVPSEPVMDGPVSPTAPTDENNTTKMEAADRNEHLNQQVPPEY